MLIINYYLFFIKKIILLVIAVFAFNFANAQSSVVKVNPLGMAFGFFNASYEFLVSDASSIEVGAGFVNFQGVSGYDVNGKYKFYFLDSTEAPRGLYAAPVAGYSGITDGDDNIGMFRVGAIAGYQFIFGGGDSGFALDLNAGLRYRSISADSSVFNGGVGASFGLGIGYAF